MAEILPMSTDLSEDMEGSSIDVTFTAQFLEGETLESINIIDYEATPGVNVEGNRLFGTYQDVFALGGDALKYRTIQGQLLSADSWDSLPSSLDAQLYYFRAPKALTKTFNYVVELIYWYQAPSTGGSAPDDPVVTPPAEKRTIRKTYFKTIVGNWSRWANQLRSYVYARP